MPTEQIKRLKKSIAVVLPEIVDSKESQYASRAVIKAFALLKILGGADQPQTLHQLALAVKLTKSSTFRLLRTLESLQHVTQGEDGRYATVVAERSNRYLQVANVINSIAHPAMQALQMQFRETVSLAVLFNNHIEVVDVIDSPHIVRMANTVGRILPPHASSLGKAVTAFQTAAVSQQLLRSYGLPQLTPATLTDDFALAKELEQIRSQGFSCELEESVRDGCCFGSPIFLDTSFAVAAMSISMPKTRVVQGEERDALTSALCDATGRVSKSLHAAIYNVG